MKIYFDGIIYSWQTGGGVYRYFEEIIRRCGSDKRVEPILLMHTPSYDVTAKGGVVVKNILRFKVVPRFSFVFLRKILSPINRIILENYFSRISDGVFHSTYYTTYKNLKIPQVLTVHDMTHERFPEFFNEPGAKRFIANKKKCIMNADSIICISEATKKALQSTYQVDNKKITVVHHGISENFLREPEVDIKKYEILNEPYVLFVGHRGLFKNFAFFIEAFSKWKNNKKYNVILVGGFKLSKEELSIINKLGLGEQVKHLGFVEEKDLKYIYQRSKAFVFPSLEEGFGFPILEAISSKTQVIASDIAPFKEIGEDMVIYFDPRNPESLVSALGQSDLRDVSREELERRAEYVIAKFSWEKCFEKTVEVYRKAIYEKNN